MNYKTEKHVRTEKKIHRQQTDRTGRHCTGQNNNNNNKQKSKIKITTNMKIHTCLTCFEQDSLIHDFHQNNETH